MRQEAVQLACCRRLLFEPELNLQSPGTSCERRTPADTGVASHPNVIDVTRTWHDEGLNNHSAADRRN